MGARCVFIAQDKTLPPLPIANWTNHLDFFPIDQIGQVGTIVGQSSGSPIKSRTKKNGKFKSKNFLKLAPCRPIHPQKIQNTKDHGLFIYSTITDLHNIRFHFQFRPSSSSLVCLLNPF
jgi:hypothetical protein